jgi:3-hydroxyacyl-[acyl-carrier-protein] dehydratase
MLIPGLYTTEQPSCTDASCWVIVRYNYFHPLYKGHFPGQPITPGVCLIQTATELLERALGASLRLSGARQVKFLQMHTPEKPLKFELSWSETSPVRGRIAIFQDQQCIAKIDAQFERI